MNYATSKVLVSGPSLISTALRVRFPNQLIKASSLINCSKRYKSTNIAESAVITPQKEIATSITEKTFKLPQPSSFEGSFQNDYERVIKYSLIPLTMIPFYTSYAGISLPPLMDATITSLFLFYSHYGFTSLIIDYIPKKRFPKTQKVSLWSLYTATFVGLCGIYQLETENNGVIDLITRLWNDDEKHLYIFGRN